ncbi:MAG: hypothetical protein RBT71_11395, partial [Flavobacteriales bacterium]|nr:hypothetical protein [Flavobacteriales bacterium]
QAAALHVREQLFAGVDQVGNLPGNTVTGGRINANNSMQLIMADCGGFCPTPGGPTVTTTGTTAVLVQWTGEGGGTIDLRYRPVGAPTWTTISGITGAQQAVGGLTACTAYEFQVRRNCADEAQSGWSAAVTWLHPDCCSLVTVNVVTDRYGGDVTWSLTGGGTTYATGGPYADQGSNGAYPQAPVSVCLPDGCYQLVVNDSYGDGICCNYGNGHVQVLGPEGTVLGTTPNGSYSQVVLPFCIETRVRVNARAILEGPYTGPLMDDGLRTAGLIPATEPYTASGWPQVQGGGETIGAGVLAVSGPNAIVDWVRMELRQSGTPGTVVATRQALLQRDGDIVDAADGASAVDFGAPPGNYHLVVRHRNHLGAMTAVPIALGSTAVAVDLASAATATYGSGARKAIGGVRALWAGDVSGNGQLRYTGAGNDRDPILSIVGGSVPTAVVGGYLNGDVNMDGSVRYTGPGNDRDPVLVNIGGAVPTASRTEQVP